ncbi:MAG TPA: response regulator [Acidimicrobiales bacterium]|nr:response regulator [Acidimicrobiales bacterium]
MADVLVASDAEWIIDDVRAAVGDPDVTLRSVRSGVDVLPAVQQRIPDLVILDLQIGNMGGMATCLHLRLEESAGRLPHLPVLMLLDRRPDVFLARRSEAEGWILKPLDAIRLRKAVRSLLAGEPYEDPTNAPVPLLAAPAGTASGDGAADG